MCNVNTSALNFLIKIQFAVRYKNWFVIPSLWQVRKIVILADLRFPEIVTGYFCNANNLNRDWKRTPLNTDVFSIKKFARCKMFIAIIIMDLKIDRLSSNIYKQHIKNPTMNPKFPLPINQSNRFSSKMSAYLFWSQDLFLEITATAVLITGPHYFPKQSFCFLVN